VEKGAAGEMDTMRRPRKIDRSFDGDTAVRPLLNSAEWNEVVRTLCLSPQQSRIVELLLQGKKDKSIAADLGLNVWTVRTHLTRIFRRLKIDDRVGLILRVFSVVHRRAD
jgi:DNA-binding NarL/FixJ family response regulator